MKKIRRSLLLSLFALALPAATVGAFELNGSPASMVRQHAVAVSEDYAFLRTPADVRDQVAAGDLVRVADGADYVLADVSFPDTRAEVFSFIQHFSARFHTATGNRLVITSLTRPLDLQPRNAHPLSVHPAGMAVDLRVPADAADRAWLERALLDMERDGLLDVTRERKPAHYHIAVFATPFLAYAARIDSIAADSVAEVRRRDAVARALAWTPSAEAAPARGGPATFVLAGAWALFAALPLSRRLRRLRSRNDGSHDIDDAARD